MISIFSIDNLDQPLSGISTGNYTATLIGQQDGIWVCISTLRLRCNPD